MQRGLGSEPRDDEILPTSEETIVGFVFVTDPLMTFTYMISLVACTCYWNKLLTCKIYVYLNLKKRIYPFFY